MTFSSRPWNSGHLDALLQMAYSRGEPSVIRMNARDYADIRKFGRDVLDIESEPSILKTGRQAVYSGIPIYVLREVDNGVVSVLDGKGTILSRRRAVKDLITHCYPGESCECGDCVMMDVMGT